jgi:hypothetical protein
MTFIHARDLIARQVQTLVFHQSPNVQDVHAFLKVHSSFTEPVGLHGFFEDMKPEYQDKDACTSHLGCSRTGGKEWNGSILTSWVDSDPCSVQKKSRNKIVPFSVRFWNRAAERPKQDFLSKSKSTEA